MINEIESSTKKKVASDEKRKEKSSLKYIIFFLLYDHVIFVTSNEQDIKLQNCLKYTLLYEMPSNSKGKNFVSKIQRN